MGSSATLRRFPGAAVLLRVASDERLVEHVRGGSEAAFEAIYDRHHRGILAFCRHMLSSPDEAEDAVQHTFMSAYRHLVGGSADIRLRPWLYTIARNRCLSLLRARRERPLAEYDEPATDHLSAEAQRRSDVRDLLGDVARLPEEQRAALVLSELGAVSHDEIAAILGVHREKVKALVFQARTSLAASRKARETPCEEIREQLANLRGGALRRTTIHRHVRECAGCREFRDEVAEQRRTMAIALPVIPSLGLKEAALGAAFGSGGAGGGAATLAGGGALAAKALVAVALVGGGTTATVEIVRDAAPAPQASAAMEQPAPAPAPTATAGSVEPAAATEGLHSAAPAARAERRHAASTARHAAKRHGARGHGKRHRAARAHVPPGRVKPKRIAPGQAKRAETVKPASPGRAKHPAAAKPVAPGLAKGRSAPRTVAPGRAKTLVPTIALPAGRAKQQ